tara:strand:- start:3452 stop:4690 length:1239 start_codon:yes stop_codon:yes gene_type:complete
LKINFERFIVKKLHSNEILNNSISDSILKISIFGISISLVIMILTIACGIGLQNEISNKITGFTSDFQISNMDFDNTINKKPLEISENLFSEIKKINNVTNVKRQITKNTIIKTKNDIDGLVFKGIDENFDENFINNKIIEGKKLIIDKDIPNNSILISKSISSKLNFNSLDTVILLFQDQKKIKPIIKKFVVEGVFTTGIKEIDDIYVIGDIKYLQKINKWDSNQCTSVEVSINNDRNRKKTRYDIESIIPYNFYVLSSSEIYSEIYEWINLFNQNIKFIITIMLIICIVNITCSIISIIVERLKMIGILKILGSNNTSISKIFFSNWIFIMKRSLFFGNTISLILILIQKKFNILKLNPENYYVNYLPLNLSINNFLLVNTLTIASSLLLLFIPYIIIKKTEAYQMSNFE